MNWVAAFQEMKRLYGFCPCCGELFRLSEATLFTADPPPTTEFDKIEDRRRRLERANEKFDEQEGQIRAAAVQKGQQEAKKRLKKIAPFFIARRIDPQDVKVIFNPVNYVVFRGLNSNGVRTVELVDSPAETKAHERIHQSIAAALRAGNVEWATLRIEDGGQVVRE